MFSAQSNRFIFARDFRYLPQRLISGNRRLQYFIVKALIRMCGYALIIFFEILRSLRYCKTAPSLQAQIAIASVPITISRSPTNALWLSFSLNT